MKLPFPDKAPGVLGNSFPTAIMIDRTVHSTMLLNLDSCMAQTCCGVAWGQPAVTPEVKEDELTESTSRHLWASRDRQIAWNPQSLSSCERWASFPSGVHDVTASFLRARRDGVF